MKTPDALIAELDDIRARLARTAVEIRDAELAADAAERDYKREAALAYRRASGSIEDRKQQATLDVESFAIARDDTATILTYAKTRRANLELEQSNLQTQARLIDSAARLGGGDHR